MARVLIIDDSLLIRTVLREILDDEGLDVVGEAQDGPLAPDRVRELHPDLVMLDLVMPGRNGLATLEHLMQLDPSLVVVVCSASLDQARVIEALRRGPKGFIVKPFTRETVLVGVRKALGEPELPHRLDHDDTIERLHHLCRGLADELREILESAIDTRKATLEQSLALEYEELRGPHIQELARLFEVGHLSVQRFDPPKFRTGYDALVDRQMMQRMDAVLAAEPRLTFALPLDLNVYAPAHNRVFSRDPTGDPAQDLGRNRTKRFFLDSDDLLHAARMELGVELPPRRFSRAEIERAGGRLHQPPPNAARTFLLSRYQRDAGAVLTTLSVPLYVKHQRWGIVTLGWDPTDPPNHPHPVSRPTR